MLQIASLRRRAISECSKPVVACNAVLMTTRISACNAYDVAFYHDAEQHISCRMVLNVL